MQLGKNTFLLPSLSSESTLKVPINLMSKILSYICYLYPDTLWHIIVCLKNCYCCRGSIYYCILIVLQCISTGCISKWKQAPTLETLYSEINLSSSQFLFILKTVPLFNGALSIQMTCHLFWFFFFFSVEQQCLCRFAGWVACMRCRQNAEKNPLALGFAFLTFYKPWQFLGCLNIILYSLSSVTSEWWGNTMLLNSV